MPFRQMRGRFLQAGTASDRWRVRSPSGRRTADALPVWRKCLPANSTSKTSSSPQPPPPGGGLHLRVPQAARAGPPLGCGLIACDWNRPRRGRRAAASRRRRPAVRCRTWRALRRLQPELEYMPKRTRKALLILNFEFAAPRKEPPPPPFFEAKFSFSGQRYYLCRL